MASLSGLAAGASTSDLRSTKRRVDPDLALKVKLISLADSEAHVRYGHSAGLLGHGTRAWGGRERRSPEPSPFFFMPSLGLGAGARRAVRWGGRGRLGYGGRGRHGYGGYGRFGRSSSGQIY